MTQRRNATIMETRKTVLSKCQGLSGRASPPARLLLQILQPPFLQGVTSLLVCGAGIDVATLLLGVVIFTSSSSVVSPAPCRCASTIFVVDSNLDGGSIWKRYTHERMRMKIRKVKGTKQR